MTTETKGQSAFSCGGMILAAVITAAATIVAAWMTISASHEKQQQELLRAAAERQEQEAELNRLQEQLEEERRERVRREAERIVATAPADTQTRPVQRPESDEPPPRPIEAQPPQPRRLEPAGSNASLWGPGTEPRKAFDGDVRYGWGMELLRVRGAWLEALFQSQRTISGLRMYWNPVESMARPKTLTVISDSGATRTVNFKGFDRWEEVTFSPLSGLTFRFEVDEVRTGSSGYFQVYELELLGY